MSESRVGVDKMPLKPALKRNQRQSPFPPQQHLSKTSKPFQVPEGLRSLLNDITKEVFFIKACLQHNHCLKNTLTYSNTSIVVVNAAVVGSAPAYEIQYLDTSNMKLSTRVCW
jgi:hypothetical protein